ncbi:MAG: hypothetical protein Q7T72_09900 [Bacteroidales bacterium]|nr:hypothetical protein [Bacteroidales bacterium]MDP3003242.1 hypothetical protein [Bacteroidales bacterium]
MDNWESLYIYFISGTGNARASSEWIADEAGKKGLKTCKISCPVYFTYSITLLEKIQIFEKQ